MGPYCKFCDRRCFTYFPEGTPPEVLRAYGSSTIIATCQPGQQFEKQQTGYCYNDIAMLPSVRLVREAKVLVHRLETRAEEVCYRLDSPENPDHKTMLQKRQERLMRASGRAYSRYLRRAQ